MVEFETIGVGNIKGCEIEVYSEIDISSLSEDFIAEYGITSEDVPFPYYRIPYGRFKVDTCPRQSDMTKRKVTAYTMDLKNGMSLSDVEKAKQKLAVSSNVPYEFELLQFLFSNVKGIKIDNNFTTTDITLEEASETFSCGSTLSFTEIWATVSGHIIKINGGDDLEKSLIKINYERVSDYSSIKEEIINLIQKNYASEEFILKHLGAYVFLKGPTTRTPHLFEEVPSRTVAVNDGEIIYPYINGAGEYGTSTRGYFNIFLPQKIQIRRITSTINSTTYYTLGTWTIAENYSAELLTASDELYNPLFSMERTKLENGYYAFQGNINLTKYVTAWMELNALFGKYARDGGIELFNLQNRMELYPSEYLYPSEDLYPVDYENEEATSELITEHEYHSEGFWYEEYQVKPFGKVVVDYVDLEGNDQTYVYQFDPDAPNVYYMDNNEIFKTVQMAEADVKALLDTYFIPNANDTVFTPVELRMRGRPDIEAGDYLDIVSKEGNIFTFVLRRTLTGIQNLIDDIETKCNEINEDTTDTSLLVEGV